MATQNLFNEFQKRSTPVRHVMFVVHGIGPSIGNGGYFLSHIENLKCSLAEIQSSKFEQEGAIEIFPIEWHNVLHELVDNAMNSVTLPTCQFVRSVNNNILADVLFYFSKHHGQVIIETVANALNNSYDQFMNDNPNYDGTFSLVGYSLGGVCCYDILAHQEKEANVEGRSQVFFDVPKLKFQPSNFFALGSPIGVILVMRNQKFDSYQVPDSCTFNNIFHPYDPIGYRIEPLIEDRYKEISPHPIDFSQDNRFPFRLPSYEDFVFVNVPSRLSLPSFPSVSPPQVFDKMLESLNRQFSAALGLMSIIQRFRQNSNFLTESIFRKGHRISFNDTKRIIQVEEDKELGIDIITLLPNADCQNVSLETGLSTSVRTGFGQPSSDFISVGSNQSSSIDMGDSQSINTTTERCDEIQKSGDEDENNYNNDDLLSESIYYCENGREIMPSFLINTPEEGLKGSTMESWVSSNTGLATQKIFRALKRMSSNLPGMTTKSMPAKEDREEVCFQFSDQSDPVSRSTLMQSPVETMEAFFSELYMDTDRDYAKADALTPMLEVAADSCCGTVEPSSIVEDPLPFKQHPNIKHRVDFVLQGNFIDYVSHQYVLGSRAHFSYWNNRDVAYHMLKRIL